MAIQGHTIEMPEDRGLLGWEKIPDSEVANMAVHRSTSKDHIQSITVAGFIPGGVGGVRNLSEHTSPNRCHRRSHGAGMP